jgi:hypothetical protein
MGERSGNDKVFIKLSFDAAGERMGCGDNEGAPRLTLGFGEPSDHEERNRDQRQRHDKREQTQMLSQRKRRSHGDAPPARVRNIVAGPSKEATLNVRGEHVMESVLRPWINFRSMAMPPSKIQSDNF